MKLISLIIPLVLVLVGCASTQEVNSTHRNPNIVLDEQCSMIAKYARAIAILRDLNVPQSEVNYVLQSPINIDLDSFQRDIYLSKDGNPVETSIKLYNKCTNISYSEMVKHYANVQVEFNNDLSAQVKDRITEAKSIKETTLKLKRLNLPADMEWHIVD